MKHLSIIIIAILFFLTSCEKAPLLVPDFEPTEQETVPAKTDKDWGGLTTETTETNQIEAKKAALHPDKESDYILKIGEGTRIN